MIIVLIMLAVTAGSAFALYGTWTLIGEQKVNGGFFCTYQKDGQIAEIFKPLSCPYNIY